MANKVRNRNGTPYDFEDGIKVKGQLLDDLLLNKQDLLISGQNLKTVGGISLLGQGDIGNLGSDGITLVGSPQINPTQTNTYTISNYDSFETYVITADAGQLTLNGQSFNLFAPANISATSINIVITKGSITKTYTISVGAAYVNTPLITSPTQGQLNFNVTGPFTTNAFSTTPTNVDQHELTDWQFSLSADFSTILYQSTGNTQALTSYSPPSNALPYSTVMYVRARHRGLIRGYSAWSDARQFTTRPEITVNTPSINSPSAGQTNFPVAGPFVSSAFATTNGSDTHLSSDWQFSTNSSFTAIVHQSTNNTQALTSYSPPTGQLSNSTVYYVRVRHKGTIAGDSAWSAGRQFTTIPPLSVNTPSISSPTAGATGTARTLTVTASAFGVQNGTDTHASSTWQFSTVTDFSSVFHESIANATSKTSYTVPAGALNAGTQYYVRVKYIGASGVSSSYSNAVNFTTLQTGTPSITSPASNATNVDPLATFTSSAFSSTGTDTHATSDWQFSTVINFASIAHESIGNNVSKTSYVPPANALNFETTYYVRVRHSGTEGGPGNFSTPVLFTVRAAVTTNAPTVTSPLNNATGVTVTPTITTAAYSTTNGSDTHAGSDWQIATNTTFTNIVYQSINSSSNLTSLSVPAGNLSNDTVYYLRTRHRGAISGYGAYSSTVMFTTLKTNTPSITSPTNGQAAFNRTGPFTSSAFSSTGTDTHISTDWQIATDTGFTNIVVNIAASTTSKTSLTLTVGQLNKNVQYYIRVRHYGITGGTSAWSTATTFVTYLSDGSTWQTKNTSVGLGERASAFNRIIYTGNRYVVCGQSSISFPQSACVYYSINGNEWVRSASFPVVGVSNFTSVASHTTNIDTLIAVGNSINNGVYSGSVFKSVDGAVTWSQVTGTFNTTAKYLNSVTCGNGIFVLAGNNNGDETFKAEVYYSNDSTNWTRATGAFNTNINLVDKVLFLNGLFFLIGRNTTAGTTLCYTSTNGVTWTQRSIYGSTDKYVTSISYGGGVYTAVAVDSNSMFFTSSDGFNWVQGRTYESVTIQDIQYNTANQNFIAVGLINNTDTAVYLSANGVDWENSSVSKTSQFRSLVNNGDEVYVISGNASIHRFKFEQLLTPGATIGMGTNPAATMQTQMVGCLYIEHLDKYYSFVSHLTGSLLDIYQSTDGIGWSKLGITVNVGTSTTPSVAYDGTYCYICSSNGVYYSTTMTSWASATLPGAIDSQNPKIIANDGRVLIGFYSGNQGRYRFYYAYVFGPAPIFYDVQFDSTIQSKLLAAVTDVNFWTNGNHFYILINASSQRSLYYTTSPGFYNFTLTVRPNLNDSLIQPGVSLITFPVGNKTIIFERTINSNVYKYLKIYILDYNYTETTSKLVFTGNGAFADNISIEECILVNNTYVLMATTATYGSAIYISTDGFHWKKKTEISSSAGGAKLYFRKLAYKENSNLIPILCYKISAIDEFGNNEYGPTFRYINTTEKRFNNYTPKLIFYSYTTIRRIKYSNGNLFILDAMGNILKTSDLYNFSEVYVSISSSLQFEDIDYEPVGGRLIAVTSGTNYSTTGCGIYYETGVGTGRLIKNRKNAHFWRSPSPTMYFDRIVNAVVNGQTYSYIAARGDLFYGNRGVQLFRSLSVDGVYNDQDNAQLTSGMTSTTGLIFSQGRIVLTGIPNIASPNPYSITTTDANGLNWTFSQQSNAFYAVAGGQNKFVFVGPRYIYCGFSTPLPLNTVTTPDLTNTILNDVTYGGGNFIAAGNNNGAPCILTSPDGITWTFRSIPTNMAQLNTVAYIPNQDFQYVAGGAAGAFLAS